MKNIPVYPEMRPIEKTDKTLFKERYRTEGLTTSEYTFTNFFIWRKSDRSQVTAIHDNLCIWTDPIGGSPHWFIPLGGKEIVKTLEIMLAHTPLVRHVPAPFLPHLEPMAPRLHIAHDQSQSDYIYLTKQLIELKGRAYDGKRNHIRRFQKAHPNFSFHPLREMDIPHALNLLETWMQAKRLPAELFPKIEHEAAAVTEALHHFKWLGLTGGAIWIEENLEAFSIGEPLNQEAAVVYIEKANPHLPGLAPLMNQQGAEHLWHSFTYLNREQDLGLPGLRKAKLSYHPHHFEEKYSLALY